MKTYSLLKLSKTNYSLDSTNWSPTTQLMITISSGMTEEYLELFKSEMKKAKELSYEESLSISLVGYYYEELVELSSENLIIVEEFKI